MGRRKKDAEQTIPGMAPVAVASAPAAKTSQSVSAPKAVTQAAVKEAVPEPLAEVAKAAHVASDSMAAQVPAASSTAPVATKPAAAKPSKAVAPSGEANAKPSKASAQPTSSADAPLGAKPKAKSDARSVGATASSAAPAGASSNTPAAAVQQPKAKADAKAKAKAKADPKAQAKAPAPQAVAKADPKAKAKATAAAPTAQVPGQAAEDAGDGMEAVRKRRRGRKKADEVDQLEAEVPTDPMAGPSQEELGENARLKAEHDKHHKDLFEALMQEYKAVPKLNDGNSSEEVFKEVQSLRHLFEKIVSDADGALVKHKCPRPKILDATKILDQMKELRQCKADSTSFTEEARQEMLAEKRTELSKAHRWESYCRFQDDVGKLKELCTKKLKENEETAKQVKAGNDKRRIAGRVAKSKGIEASELDGKTVVSFNVDLPQEVTHLSFLFKQRFERQHGVVIDRPDAKGLGKGAPAPPPKSLIVRGVEADAAACAKELRALDLSEKKVCATTARQASVVMGANQQNARRLQEEFKVFIHNERNQVTLYGSKQEVKKCYENVVATLPSEEASAGASAPAATAPMLVDKDRARALIGANGKIIKKLEADTGTSIKVIIPKKEEDDEDSKATVRITAKDSSSVEKARRQINQFVDNLATCLVEADDEVVSRLYDGARISKGGGKSKGKEGDEGRSKFAELRDDSGLAVLRKAGSGILLVGDKPDVRQWASVLRECVKEAGVAPARVTLTPLQVRLWAGDRLESLKASTGAEIRLVRRGGKGEGATQYLEVTGGSEERAKAQAQIDELHEQLGHADTITDISDTAAKSLSANRMSKIHSIEKNHEVTISMDRQAKSMSILGAEARVAEARKELEAIISAASSIVTQEIDIQPEEGGIVIGKSGVMVKSIRETTGIDDLQVEGDRSKKVVLKGSAEAVEAAAKMVNEVLQRARDLTSGDKPASNRASNREGSGAKENGARASSGERGRRGGGDRGEGAPADGAASAETEHRRQEASPAKGDGKGKGKGGGKAGKPDDSRGSQAQAGSPTSPATAGDVKWGDKQRKPRQPAADIKSTELCPSLGASSGSTAKRRQVGATAWGRATEEEEKKEEEEEEEEEVAAAGADETAAEASGDAAAAAAAAEDEEAQANA